MCTDTDLSFFSYFSSLIEIVSRSTSLFASFLVSIRARLLTHFALFALASFAIMLRFANAEDHQNLPSLPSSSSSSSSRLPLSSASSSASLMSQFETSDSSSILNRYYAPYQQHLFAKRRKSERRKRMTKKSFTQNDLHQPYHHSHHPHHHHHHRLIRVQRASNNADNPGDREDELEMREEYDEEYARNDEIDVIDAYDDNDAHHHAKDLDRFKRSKMSLDNPLDYEIIGDLTGVAGGKISIPCNITPTAPNDAVSLILWYKDDSTTPIYSVDARKGQSLDAARRMTHESLASRSYMSTATNPYAHLILELLTPDDNGEYACRVDFRKERTRNSVVFLKVIIPPEKPQITDINGEPLASLIGPYTEGDRLVLVCEVEGGSPLPSVTWWRESVLLDDSFEKVNFTTSSSSRSSSRSTTTTTTAMMMNANGSPTASTSTTTSASKMVRNQLLITALQRQDLMAVFTCQASNNNFSLPSTSTVTVDLNFRPLSVKIIGERRPLSADKVSQLTCESSGSRPHATISWWMGSTRLKHSEEQHSVDGNTTTSVLAIKTTIDDIGKTVTCRAENTQIASSAIEDTVKLDINYVPQITLKLGSNLRHSHIQEGNDVYFECLIRASPAVTEIRWHFEGRELRTNTSAGVILSNQSLVLQKVRRHQRGRYTCTATNAEGEGQSNSIHLRVQYAPVCKTGQKILYGAARHEQVSVLCEVDADPMEVNFNWSYNGTGGELHRLLADSASSSGSGNHLALSFESSGKLSSIARYTPRTEFDFGTISCWAANSVGSQAKPCSYSIVAAGSPDPVRNCSIRNITEDSMKIDCAAGYDGGLLQHFVLEMFDTTERTSTLRANLSASTPHFSLTRLQPAHAYLVVMYAANSKGRSKEMVMTAFTLAMPESMNRLAKGNVWQLNFNPVLVVLVAIVAGIVIVAFFIVALVRYKTTKTAMHRYRDISLTSSSEAATTTKNTDLTEDERLLSNEKLHHHNNHQNHHQLHHQLHHQSSSSDRSGSAAAAPTLMSASSSSSGCGAGGAQSQQSLGNIYTSTPLPAVNEVTSGATNEISSSTLAATNKHVTWRPETPPSPPPNVYTPFSNITYVPASSSGEQIGNIREPALASQYHQLVSDHNQAFATSVPLHPHAHSHHSSIGNAIPISYSVTGGISGYQSLGAAGFVIEPSNSTGSMPQYGTLPHHQHHQPVTLPMHWDGGVTASGSGYIYAQPQHQPQQPQPQYGTLQHPRRVRVLPPNIDQANATNTSTTTAIFANVGSLGPNDRTNMMSALGSPATSSSSSCNNNINNTSTNSSNNNNMSGQIQPNPRSTMTDV